MDGSGCRGIDGDVAIADGRPWNMVAIDSKNEFKLTLMPNGGARLPGTRADLVAK